jgi:putative N6-adenine-specific DNA methylase
VDSSAWLLVGDLELAKRIGLRPRRRIVLFNGPIECRLLGFELFTGSTASRRPAARS